MPKPFRRQPSSIARHHAEWLSLLEISGPFLSMPVLVRAFPQGLEADDPDLRRDLRAVHEEWLDNQGGLRPDPAIHRAWVEWVLRTVLGMPDVVLLKDPAQLAPYSVQVAEYGETLRPDIAVAERGAARARLLVQILPHGQALDHPLPKHAWAAAPDTRMMELLHATEIALGLVTNGEQWMLVHAPRGQTTGYISWYTEIWLDEPITLRAFRTLLSTYRFFGVPEEMTLEHLLAESADEQHEVTEQLGYQVRRAVELLVQAIDMADQDRGRAILRGVPETELYRAAVTVMMRLVFLFCAEERGLLLLGDPLYDEHYAVSTLRALLHERADQSGEEVLERRTDAWCRLLATFRAVHGGIRHDRLQLPAHGGGLFDPDAFPFLEGRTERSEDAAARPLPIHNRTILHLLDALQMLQVQVPGGGPAEARRLSFRALDIEQIGHVYEGLLDHTAVRAAEPVLGLQGTRNKEPEIPLSELEAQRAKGEESLVAFLHEKTGRSPNTLAKSLSAGADLERATRLRVACGNDEALYERVLPWAGLVRDDDYGRPVVIRAGSVYVTAGAERRSTGTHYTPRSLTEPIVQHTLEPLVYAGPAEGQPREAWALRSPKELLALKVCDMAMGSGAFLVQACRYLSERLVEAWERAADAKAPAMITVEGTPTRNPDEAIPADVDERLTLARRLVADRCLYGVDKNPLAVEMAKLSLWLITLDKGRPFTYLDHALKCGDSLVGASRTQLLFWTLHPDPKQRLTREFGTELDVAKVIALRREIAALPDRDIRDQELKAHKLAQAEAITNDLRAGADLLIASYFTEAKGKAAEALREALWRSFRQRADAPPETPDLATVVPGGLRPFHWELEFPEVFLAEGRGGFDAIVGNPPFMGGMRISTMLGAPYLSYLRQRYPKAKGTADLCAFFYLRAHENLRPGGCLGLIATNTIAQGDTREAGLDELVRQGATIYAADSSRAWPGKAAVYVSIVHIRKGPYKGPKELDGAQVADISSLLDSTSTLGKPHALAANAGKSFIGSYVLGLGFTMSPEEAQALIAKDPRNAEVLFPYLIGEDLNSRPDQSPSRWVINFFDWPLERAEQYPDCIAIVREKVYPERAKVNRTANRERWWQYAEKRPGLYAAIARLRRVLIRTRVSNTHAPCFVLPGQVFSEATVIFAFDDSSHFAVMQSSVHEAWVRTYTSTLKGDTRYSPSDCFETFPFPADLTGLETIGETYHERRRQIMLARQEGLTKTYNRFHDPAESAEDIAQLRRLHVEMDQAVAAAYGWRDLDLGHGFRDTPQGVRYTLSEPARREVLRRLLELNFARHEEEVRAGAGTKGKKGQSKQGRLL